MEFFLPFRCTQVAHDANMLFWTSSNPLVQGCIHTSLIESVLIKLQFVWRSVKAQSNSDVDQKNKLVWFECAAKGRNVLVNNQTESTGL